MPDLVTIPLLDEELSSGIGKFNGKIAVRKASGTEAGTLLADVEFVHEDLTRDDCERIETFLDGATRAYDRAYGEGSDGRRPLGWKPIHGAVELEFSVSPAGQLLYRGRATLKRAELRIVPQAAVLTVYARLEAFDPEAAVPILRSLGLLVDYQLRSIRVEGASADGRTSTGADGELPFGSDLRPGELVTFAAGHGEPAIVISVGSGQVIARRSLVDRPDVVPFNEPVSAVATHHAICGPKGGPLADAIARLATRCPAATPADLILALIRAQATGATTCLEHGWALTQGVADLVAEIAGEAPPEPAVEPPPAPPEAPEAPEELDLDADLVGDHAPDYGTRDERHGWADPGDPVVVDDEGDVLPPDADVDRGELLDPEPV